MITATIKIKFEGSWVDQISKYDAEGLSVASSIQGRRVFAIHAIDADTEVFTDVIDTIRENQYVKSLDVLEEYETDGRTFATISTREEYLTYPIDQILGMEGFLPVGYVEYRNGYQFREVFAEEREDVSQLVSVLDYDTVEVVSVYSDVEMGIGFSLLEWQQLLSSISEGEREVLDLVVESGYTEIPREISLDELAAEAGIAKSTASRRLRNLEQKVIPMITRYAQIFS